MIWLNDPLAWKRKSLYERLELLQSHYCTGPCGQSSAILATRSALAYALRESRQEINKANELKAALEDLVDCQNGPPMVKYTKDWNAAMAQAYHLLGREPWVYQE